MKQFMIPAISIGIICTIFFLWQIYRWRGVRPWLAFLAIPLVLLCFGYPLGEALSQHQTLSAILFWGNKIWLTLAAIFTAIIIILEFLRRLLRIYLKRSEGAERDVLPPKRSVPLGLVLLALVCAYAVFEAQNVRPKHIAIQTDKLPEGVNNYRIVFISDLHLNELAGQKMLGRVLKVVEEQNADVLLFGGDIVSDKNMKVRQREAAMLAKAMPPNGSFGVLGNHEAYYGHLDNSIPFLKRAWIHVMRGEAISVGNIFLVGVDDPEIARVQGSTEHDPMQILERMPRDRFIILLKHRPDIQPESVGFFDLQLSGHSHGGQIWPGKLLVNFLYGAPQGKLNKLESSHGTSWYYATHGAGFSSLPLRLLTPPEVVVIDLLR